MQDLATPFCPDAGREELEEFRVKLLDNATKMAAMTQHAEATQRESDRVVGRTSAAAETRRASVVRQRRDHC